MYIKVVNGKIIEEEFPKKYITKTEDGFFVNKSVSFLKDEGWLPVEDVRPFHRPSREYLILDKTEILEDKVRNIFKVVSKVKEEEVILNLLEDFETDGNYIS